MKYLNIYKKQSYCGERLLAVIVEELTKMSKDYEGEDFKKLTEVAELGKTLLTKNYYEDADRIEKNLVKEGKELLSNLITEDYSIIDLLNARNTARESKKKDYVLFFNELAENIEEWC